MTDELTEYIDSRIDALGKKEIRDKYEKLAEFLEDSHVCPGRYGGLYLAGDESYWVEYDADANEPGWKVFKNE